MTKKQCLNKIRKLLGEGYILGESQRLLNTGGIDYNHFEDDFTCPRIVLKVASKNFSNEIATVAGSESDIKNLSNF